ncbi:MAG: arginine repressor, partial [Clostridiaceae bacterium]|nr:arginine repressor [Clostridiaceae bacterium]
MKKAPKKQRQSRILQLVGERNIETQSDLVDALRTIGMDVTQATVSRDIKELGIVKVMT